MDTEKVYDDNARKWLRMAPSSLSDFTARPAVFDACGEVSGRSILDIGCGEGYCARELKQRGAGYYLGVDLSTQMIAAATEQETIDPLGIEYQASNIIEFSPGRKFDLCVAVFLFNYLRVHEMQRVMAMVFNALEAGGRFVFSVPHPLFPFVGGEEKPPFYFSAGEANYFDAVDEQFEGKIWTQAGEPLHVQCVHKTFGDYFSGLRQAGFKALPDVTELTVTPELARTDQAFFGPLLNKPLHVLFSIVK